MYKEPSIKESYSCSDLIVTKQLHNEAVYGRIPHDNKLSRNSIKNMFHSQVLLK